MGCIANGKRCLATWTSFCCGTTGCNTNSQAGQEERHLPRQRRSFRKRRCVISVSSSPSARALSYAVSLCWNVCCASCSVLALGKRSSSRPRQKFSPRNSPTLRRIGRKSHSRFGDGRAVRSRPGKWSRIGLTMNKLCSLFAGMPSLIPACSSSSTNKVRRPFWLIRRHRQTCRHWLLPLRPQAVAVSAVRF